MNKRKKDIPLSSLSKRLMLKYFLPIGVYTALVFFLVKQALLYCERRIWYAEEPLYQFLKAFDVYYNKSLSVVFLTSIVLLAGWLIITYRFVKKLLCYFDEISDAAVKLASPTGESIVLPEELDSIKNSLNLAREKAINHARVAKEAEQRKNDLVVYLAHDLKTPLTSVIGYLTLLHDEGQISEELREKYLSISLEKAERLEDLINEFFEITRFNLSEIELEYSRVNLTRLLEQLSFEFEPMLMEKNLKCELSIEPDIMINCDADKMQRVFDNLLRNAVNYSFPDGVIRISAAIDGNNVRITFNNAGNTIPAEKLERIFDQFYRLDTSRSSASGGAGLGLAIAKEIVQHHKGSITAKSENETVQFEVVIPVST